MGNGLDIPPPPARKKQAPDGRTNEHVSQITEAKSQVVKKRRPPVKFDKESETEKVQFNKRLDRRTADTFEMLSIRTRRKIPQLLEEAAQLLEKKYGKV